MARNRLKELSAVTVLFLIGAVALLICFMSAPTMSGNSSDKARSKLERVKKRILAEEAKLEKLRAKEESIFEQLRYLDRLVDLQKRKLKAFKKERIMVEKRIEKTNAERVVMEKRLDKKRKVLATRFRRMYMDGPSGAMEVLLTAEDYSDLARREVYYRAMVKADAEKIREFRADLDALRALIAKLEAEKARLAKVEAEIIASKEAAEKKRDDKQALLKAAKEDREVNEKVLAELRASSRRIGGIIVSHQKKKKKEVPPPPPVTSPEEPQPPPPPPPPPIGSDFGENAGRMCAPCRGRVVQGYGTITNPRFGTKTFSNGVAIGASHGTAVRAVWDGEVVYAGWFRGYGRIVILSHGERYYTLYAHLSRIAAGKGRKVQRGQVVGYVGDTGSLHGSRLYFEVRRGSGSMNPLSWISMGCGG